MTKKKEIEDYISIYHDYGIYYPSRTVNIFGEINETLTNEVIANLHILDSYTGSINIKLKSEGGDVLEARAIYDAITGCKNHVRITVYGFAESAGALILQAADERIMRENSHLMLHVGEHELAENHPRNIDNLKKFYDEMEKWMETIFLRKVKNKKPRFTRNQMKSMLTWDRYIYPKEALEFGLIDMIGEVQ